MITSKNFTVVLSAEAALTLGLLHRATSPQSITEIHKREFGRLPKENQPHYEVGCYGVSRLTQPKFGQFVLKIEAMTSGEKIKAARYNVEEPMLPEMIQSLKEKSIFDEYFKGSDFIEQGETEDGEFQNLITSFHTHPHMGSQGRNPSNPDKLQRNKQTKFLGNFVSIIGDEGLEQLFSPESAFTAKPLFANEGGDYIKMNGINLNVTLKNQNVLFGKTETYYESYGEEYYLNFRDELGETRRILIDYNIEEDLYHSVEDCYNPERLSKGCISGGELFRLYTDLKMEEANPLITGSLKDVFLGGHSISIDDVIFDDELYASDYKVPTILSKTRISPYDNVLQIFTRQVPFIGTPEFEYTIDLPVFVERITNLKETIYKICESFGFQTVETVEELYKLFQNKIEIQEC